MRALPLALALSAALLAGCTADPPPAVSQGPPSAPSVVADPGQAPPSDGTSVVEPGVTCTPPPTVSAALPDGFPEGLELPPDSVLTGVERSGGYALVSGRTAAPVAQVLEHFRGAVERAGLVVQRSEDEGRSGQLVFFGALVEGGVVVARLTCPRGQTGFTVRGRRVAG